MRGSLLHEVFAAFLRDCRERRITPDPPRDRARILEMGERAIAAIRQQVPPPNEAVFAREREELLADLQHFLAFTSGLQGREVVGIEVAFGRGAHEDQDPLAQEEPIVLTLGQGLQFALRGRMDRIDRVSPHGYEVVDYKSGRRWPREKRLSPLEHGRQLQHALYALAATELLKKSDSAAHVVGAAYWFPTGRGERDVVHRKPEEWEAALPGLISLLLSLLNDGVFPQTAISRECEWCDVAVACGPEPWRRAKKKRTEGTSRLLDAVRALEEKEYA
jgi:ATP-dependent helicase/nuclease subunit B